MEMSKGKKTLTLIVLSAIAGLVYLVPFMRYTYYDQMLEVLKIDDVQIGTMGAFYGIYALFFVPSGILSERFNTKKLLILTTFMMGVLTIWYSTYPNFQMLCTIHLLYALFSVGTFWSPYLKAVRNLGNEDEQGKLFGMSEGIRGIAQALVSFACLWAMGHFAVSAVGFRTALYFNAAAFFILMIGVIILVPDIDKDKNKKVEGVKQESLLKVFGKTLAMRSTWVCIFVLLCGYTLWSTANSYLGTYTVRVLGIDQQTASTIATVRSYVIVFIAGFTGGFIMDKFSTKGKGMTLAFGLLLIFVGAIYASESMVTLALGITFVISYLVNVVKSTYWSILGEAGIPPEATGMTTGVISFIALTGDLFVGPACGAMLNYGENTLGDVTKGFDLIFAWMAVWSILGVAAGFILKKQAEKIKAAK